MRLSRYDEKWPQRNVPDDLRERYLAEGWWTDDTLGALVDRSLRAAPDATDQHLVGYPAVARHLSRRAHRRVPPGHRARGRGPGAGRGGCVPVAELARSSRRVLRARDGRLRARADRAHLRPQRGALHPRREPAPARTSPPTATDTSTISTSSTARTRTNFPDLELHVVVGARRGRAAGRRAAGRLERRRRCRTRVRAAVRSGAADPDDGLRARVHVGHDERSEGRDAQSPHAARGATAHACVDHAGIAQPHGLAGHARDRHARRGARTHGDGPGHPPHRPVGSDPGPGDHAGGRRRCGHRRVGLPRGHPRPSRLLRRARTADPARRARRRAGAARPGGARRRVRHPDHSGVRIDRTPVDHRRLVRRSRRQAPRHRRRADDRRRDAVDRRRRPAGRARRGRARSGRAVPTSASATRTRRSARTRSTRTAGIAAATWACSTPTASSRSPTA